MTQTSLHLKIFQISTFKSSLVLLLLSFLFLQRSPAASSSGENAIALSFLQEVLEKNLQVRSAEFRWQSLAYQPQIAATLPDPQFNYTIFFRGVQTRTGIMRNRFSVSQKIPFPGKLSTTKSIALYESHTAYWEYRAALRDTFFDARVLLADLYLIDASLSVLRDQEALLRQTETSTEALIEANQSSISSALRTRLAAEEILTQIARLEAQRVGILSRMAALRGDAQTGPAFPRYTKPVFPKISSLTNLLKESMGLNQDLEIARAEIRREQSAERLASLEYFPDISLGVEYTQLQSYSGSSGSPDPIGGTISVNLPIWWNKIDAQKKSAKAKRASAEAREAQLTANVSAQVQSAYAMADTMKKERSRYAKTILPDARDAYESSVASYSVGNISLTDLLDVQRALLAAELGLINRSADYLRAIADLERAIGEPISNTLSLKPTPEDKN
ncbi:MAG: TolC family protein [Chthoniobacterales bacterium]